MFSAGSGLFHLRFSRSPARKASATSFSSAGLGSEMDADFNDDELSSCFDDDDSSAGRGAGTDTDTEDELTAMEAIRGSHAVSALPVALQALRERQKQRAGQLEVQQRQVHLLMQQQAAQRQQQQLLLQLVQQQHRLAPVPLQSPSLSQPGRGVAAAASASVKAPGSAATLRKLRPRTTLLDGTAGWASSCRMVRSASEVENDVELTGDDAAFALFDVEVVFESAQVEALAGRHVGSGCFTPVSVPPTPGGRIEFTRATLDCTLLLLEDVASKLQHLQAAAGRT